MKGKTDRLGAFLMENELDAFLIIDDSKNNANMYYLTDFLSMDPFIYVKTLYEETIIIPQMEYDRAKAESRVGSVKSMLDYGKKREYADIAMKFLRDEGVKRLAVPRKFPIHAGDELRDKGFDVIPVSHLIEDERAIKKEYEIAYIKKAQKACEMAMQAAVDMIKESKREGNLLFREDEVLTAEMVKNRIKHLLIDLGCAIDDPIVSCGKGSANPHFSGKGKIIAEEPIIIDIFPHLYCPRYHADMTRTISVGRPIETILEMDDAVLDAQNAAIKMVKPGVKCKDVHHVVCDLFEEEGYGTIRKGDQKGFTHSTGHGVGLDCHEKPIISEDDDELQAGNVITIEPGLYDPDVGGVRLEDLLVVTDKGNENLTHFKKEMLI
jgi:Xaa-Pro aminopeptidase